MEKHTVLVTGATGFIGRWLILDLLSEGYTVTALMRKPDSQLSQLKTWLEHRGQDSDNLIAVKGDLEQDNLGLSERDYEQLSDLQMIFHLGAVMKWNLSIQEARSINVKPIKLLIQLALKSTQFKRFVQMSGFMVRSEQRLAELGISDPEKADDTQWLSLYKQLGSYEASKFESHFQLLKQLHQHSIPYTVINPGAVIGHSVTGEITQYDSIVAMIHELYKGKLPAIPGTQEDWLPVVPVDFVAKFTSRVVSLPESENQQYTLIDHRTPDLASMLGLLSAYFRVPAVKKRVPISLLKWVSKIGLESALPLPTEPLNFISSDRFDNTNTMALANDLGLELPSFEVYFEAFADYLMKTRFLQQENNPLAKMLTIPEGKVFVSGNTDNPRFVFLHGLPINSDSWKYFESHFPGETLRIDLPGLGRSSYSDADLVNYLHRLLGSITSRPVLVGHSLGAGLSVEFAERYPDLCSGVVLIAPYFLAKAPPAWKTNRPLLRTLTRLLPKGEWLNLIGGEGEYVDQAKAQMLIDMESRYYLNTLVSLLSQASRKRNETIAAFNALKVPSLVIAGESDLPVEAQASAVIAGAGHYPQITHPEKVLAVLESDEVNRWLSQPDSDWSLAG